MDAKMIDYDKLKIAHELAEKYHKLTGNGVIINHVKCYGLLVDYAFKLYIDGVPYMYDFVDLVIDKLKELTQPDKPKPKYEVGQEVWHLHHEEIESFIIRVIDFRKLYEEFLYFCNDEYDNWWLELESTLYPSREALIEAQIEHWQKLIKDDDNFVHCMVCGQPSSQIVKECGWKTQDMKNNSNFRAFKYEPNQECKHESDGTLHDLRDDVAWMNIVQKYKCKKCGEFYK